MGAKRFKLKLEVLTNPGIFALDVETFEIVSYNLLSKQNPENSFEVLSGCHSLFDSQMPTDIKELTDVFPSLQSHERHTCIFTNTHIQKYSQSSQFVSKHSLRCANIDKQTEYTRKLSTPENMQNMTKI